MSANYLERVLEGFYITFGGNPWLTRRALWEMKKNHLSLELLLSLSEKRDGPFGDHLSQLTRFIVHDSYLLQGVRNALQHLPCDEESFFRLRSAGVLTGDSMQTPTFRCLLYQNYLERHLP